jgi:signal transduction histidine kinase
MKYPLIWRAGLPAATRRAHRMPPVPDAPRRSALARLLVALIAASVALLPIGIAAGLPGQEIRMLVGAPLPLALVWVLNRMGSSLAPALSGVVMATLLPQSLAALDVLGLTHVAVTVPVIATVVVGSTPYAIVLAIYEALLLSLPDWAAGYPAAVIIGRFAHTLVALVVVALLGGIIVDRARTARTTPRDAQERTAALEEMPRVVKEIRSLMTIVLTELELLYLDVAEGTITPESLAHVVRYVRVAQQLQLGLLQDLSDVVLPDDPASPRDLAVRRFDLATRLREAMSLYAVYLERQRVSVALELPASLWVQADPRRVERVLVHVMERTRLVRPLHSDQACASVHLVAQHGHAVLRVTYASTEHCIMSARRALACCAALVERAGGTLHVAVEDGHELVTIALPLDPHAGAGRAG